MEAQKFNVLTNAVHESKNRLLQKNGAVERTRTSTPCGASTSS